MLDKARLAMTEVVQDILSSSIRTPNSTLKNINLNQVNQVIHQIERFMEQADLSRKKYKLPELKSDIKEAVELGNMKLARRTLAIALNTIEKSSSGMAGRRKRSIKDDIKNFLWDLGKKTLSKMFALPGVAIDMMGRMYEEISKHLVTMDKARLAMIEVVQDIISSTIRNSKSILKNINLNQVNQVIHQIERFMEQADLSRKKYKLPELKSDIKDAVKLGNIKFARRTLAIALNTIEKNNSKPAGRRRRSIKQDVKTFLENIRKYLGETMYSKLFALDGGKTLIFAIDITGSMNDVIEAAKAIATEISTSKRRAPPSSYILSWFSDPQDLGGAIKKKKDQVGEFVNKIGNLVARGGGDCPEYALEGMFQAIQANPEYGSPLFVFTDAPSKKDTVENVEMLLCLAEEYGITINFFTQEECQNPPGSTFESYKKLASKSGGSYLPIEDTELKRLANFTDAELGTPATVKCGGTISKKRKKRSTVDEILIPLDDTISQLVISATTEKNANGISLHTPSGVAWTEGMNRFPNVAIYIVDSPMVGNWKFRVPVDAGKYQYTVKVSSTENINFNHGYMKNVNKKILELKSPIAGEPAQVYLTISGEKQIQNNSIRMDIVDIYGKVLIPDIKPVRLNGKSGLRYTLIFDPPSDQFKILIKGRTSKNKVFQRISQRASQVKPLVLKEFYNSGRYAIKQGGSAFIMLYLFNGMGTDQVFRTSFKDNLGYKVSLLGRKRTTVRAKSKTFLRVAVRYGGGKRGRVGQNENVIILVQGSHGASATEVVSFMIKK
ncbi:Hypothetical predicted protein [Paramuricea clavata]|uniref:Hemicentin-1-like von Willebrand factor A domain-containing protein n=1 Tax=Paramuricea clavata TaxID=317549 RepID=A0A6S7HEC5_PARCT|nr:Hypothetical predicted protein [Paramuricea clavata]